MEPGHLGRGLPASSGHALVGGLVGAGLIAGGAGAINWGGLGGRHPVRRRRALAGLAISPPLGALGGFLAFAGYDAAGAARRALARTGAGRSGRRRQRWRSATAPTTRRSPSA